MGKFLRLIVKTVDESAPAHGVDAPAIVTFHTFDVEAPTVTAFISDPTSDYVTHMVIGAEVIEKVLHA